MRKQYGINSVIILITALILLISGCSNIGYCGDGQCTAGKQFRENCENCPGDCKEDSSNICDTNNPDANEWGFVSINFSELETFLYTGKELKEKYPLGAILYSKDDFILAPNGFLKKEQYILNYFTVKTALGVEFCKLGEKVGENPSLRYCKIKLERKILEDNGNIIKIITKEFTLIVEPTEKKIVDVIS